MYLRMCDGRSMRPSSMWLVLRRDSYLCLSCVAGNATWLPYIQSGGDIHAQSAHCCTERACYRWCRIILPCPGNLRNPPLATFIYNCQIAVVRTKLWLLHDRLRSTVAAPGLRPQSGCCRVVRVAPRSNDHVLDSTKLFFYLRLKYVVRKHW